MAIGDKILELTVDSDITQKHLAQKLNIAPTTLNGYIKNNREPDCKTIVKLARFFKVSCDYLLENDIAKSNVEAYFYSLPKDERLLLTNFRRLSIEKKKIALSLIDTLTNSD